ncbi:MAG: hypothetical protein ACRCZI_06375 [Cetobacterium sp.]
MKKMLVTLSICVGLLTGCIGGSDSNYIETVKQISFDDGVTVENIVREKLTGTEFQVLNEGKVRIDKGLAVFDKTGEYIFLLKGMEGKIQELASNAKVAPIVIESNDIKWEVEGETKKGKIIKAKTDKSVVKISTEQDGDYVQVYLTDIKAFNGKTGKIISDKELRNYNQLNNILMAK